jgi:hypothetical protein
MDNEVNLAVDQRGNEGTGLGVIVGASDLPTEIAILG